MKNSIGVIGVGYWGPNIIRTLQKIKSVKKITIVETDLKRIDTLKKIFPKMEFSNNIDVILKNQNIKIVIISTPAQTHYEIGKKCLLAHKNILIEKPMALKISHLKTLNNIARKNNLVLLSGDIYLYSKAIKKIKELITKKSFGNLRYFFSQRLNLGRVRKDLNVVWNLATHDLSIILFCLNFKIPVTQKSLSNYFLSSKLADTAYLHFKFREKLVANILVSWIFPEKIRKLIVCGEKKMLIYDDIEKKIFLMNKKIIPIHSKMKNMEFDFKSAKNFEYIKGKSKTYKFDKDEPLYNEIKYFVNLSNNKKAYSSHYISGYKNTLKILRCINKFKF